MRSIGYLKYSLLLNTADAVGSKPEEVQKMSNTIEEIDRQQLRLWRWALIFFFLAWVLLIVRYFSGTILGERTLSSGPVGIAMLAATIVLLALLVGLIFKLGRLAARAKADPRLREALIDNELVKWHLAQSWKAGFLGAVATPFVFLLASSFYPMDDLLLVALTTAAVGSGAFLTAFHLRSSR
jgi:hypothetical protein